MAVNAASKSSFQIVAAAALVDRDGRVLLSKRHEGKDYGGLWEFPGGKVETGETPGGALVRELYEELAIKVDDFCLAPVGFSEYVFENNCVLVLLYVCRRWCGIPRCQDVAAIRWFLPQNIDYRQMPPADRSLVGVLRELL